MTGCGGTVFFRPKTPPKIFLDKGVGHSRAVFRIAAAALAQTHARNGKRAQYSPQDTAAGPKNREFLLRGELPILGSGGGVM